MPSTVTPCTAQIVSSIPPDAGRERRTDQQRERLFRDIVTTHRAPLQAFIQRRIGSGSDAEELTQQTFVEAAKSLETFRGESAVSTWLFGIALNLVRNHLTRAPERRHGFDNDSVLADMATPEAGPERLLEGRQLVARLDGELAKLPPEMRDVLLLVAVDEFSYEDAAVMLGVPVGTVRSRVSRAREVLRLRLADCRYVASVAMTASNGSGSASLRRRPRSTTHARGAEGDTRATAVPIAAAS